MNSKMDPMGRAIADYHKDKKASKLRVFSPMFEEDEIPLTTLFRSYESMPEIERKALDMAKGRVLDVGAGAGCHSLVLQEKGLDVTAIDISPLSVRTMKERGVKKVLEQDFFTLDGQYDTILMLMNGIGIVGTLERMPEFFKQLNKILAQGGRGMDKRILSTCSIQTPKGYSAKIYLNVLLHGTPCVSLWNRWPEARETSTMAG